MGILFKFAQDVNLTETNYLYGGKSANDAAAIKAAGHELKGLISFENAVEELKLGLRSPLMTLVDFRWEMWE